MHQNNRIVRSLALGLFMLLAASLAGQERELGGYAIPPLSLGANFDIGLPVQALAQNLDRTGIGASITFLASPRRSPLRFGLEVGYQGYENQAITFLSGNPLRRFLLETNVGLLHLHGQVRYMLPVGGKFRPYAEGVLGFKYFLASSSLFEDFGFEWIQIDAYSDQNDLALSYGAGAGVEVRPFRDTGIALDFRVTYMMGSQATYLVRRNPPPDVIQDPADLFEERTSTTNLLMPRIGIQFDLTRGGGQRAERATGRDRRRGR